MRLMAEAMVPYTRVEMPLQDLMEVVAAQDIMVEAREDSMKTIVALEVVHPILEVLRQSLR
jgi:hypothetical protein